MYLKSVRLFLPPSPRWGCDLGRAGVFRLEEPEVRYVHRCTSLSDYDTEKCGAGYGTDKIMVLAMALRIMVLALALTIMVLAIALRSMVLAMARRSVVLARFWLYANEDRGY